MGRSADSGVVDLDQEDEKPFELVGMGVGSIGGSVAAADPSWDCGRLSVVFVNRRYSFSAVVTIESIKQRNRRKEAITKEVSSCSDGQVGVGVRGTHLNFRCSIMTNGCFNSNIFFFDASASASALTAHVVQSIFIIPRYSGSR